MKKSSTLFFILVVSLTAKGQSFINGDFENNASSICQYNISNLDFNSILSDVKGIGELEKLDLLRTSDCSAVGVPESGECFSSLETQDNDSLRSTALSFQLTSSLQMGSQYSFSFFDRSFPIAGPSGEIEIGVSDNDSTFGTLIATTPAADTIWMRRVILFTAPITGAYITARQKNQSFKTGEFIDNFSFDTSGTGLPESSISKWVEIFPNPVMDKLNLKIPSNYFHVLKIRIFGQDSKLIYLSNDCTSIITENYASGIYFIEFTGIEGVIRKKFIKI